MDAPYEPRHQLFGHQGNCFDLTLKASGNNLSVAFQGTSWGDHEEYYQLGGLGEFFNSTLISNSECKVRTLMVVCDRHDNSAFNCWFTFQLIHILSRCALKSLGDISFVLSRCALESFGHGANRRKFEYFAPYISELTIGQTVPTSDPSDPKSEFKLSDWVLKLKNVRTLHVRIGSNTAFGLKTFSGLNGTAHEMFPSKITFDDDIDPSLVQEITFSKVASKVEDLCLVFRIDNEDGGDGCELLLASCSNPMRSLSVTFISRPRNTTLGPGFQNKFDNFTATLGRLQSLTHLSLRWDPILPLPQDSVQQLCRAVTSLDALASIELSGFGMPTAPAMDCIKHISGDLQSVKVAFPMLTRSSLLYFAKVCSGRASCQLTCLEIDETMETWGTPSSDRDCDSGEGCVCVSPKDCPNAMVWEKQHLDAFSDMRLRELTLTLNLHPGTISKIRCLHHCPMLTVLNLRLRGRTGSWSADENDLLRSILPEIPKVESLTVALACNDFQVSLYIDDLLADVAKHISDRERRAEPDDLYSLKSFSLLVEKSPRALVAPGHSAMNGFLKAYEKHRTLRRVVISPYFLPGTQWRKKFVDVVARKCREQLVENHSDIAEAVLEYEQLVGSYQRHSFIYSYLNEHPHLVKNITADCFLSRRRTLASTTEDHNRGIKQKRPRHDRKP